MTTLSRTAEPQPGFFLVRIVQKGPWVPAVIRQEDGQLRAAILGNPADVYRVWDYGHPIARDDYDYLMADAAWCRRHAPDEPLANPDKPLAQRMSVDRFKKEVLGHADQ